MSDEPSYLAFARLDKSPMVRGLVERIDRDAKTIAKLTPRTITTVEELDALAIDAVVMSETVAYQKYSGGDWAADGRFYQTGQVALPATVLFEPSA